VNHHHPFIGFVISDWQCDMKQALLFLLFSELTTPSATCQGLIYHFPSNSEQELTVEQE